MSATDTDWGYVPPKDHGSLYVSKPGSSSVLWTFERIYRPMRRTRNRQRTLCIFTILQGKQLSVCTVADVTGSNCG